MAIDEMTLTFQRAIDRLLQRLYRGEPEVAAVALPSSITHPVQLYDHFIRYQEAA